ncbi:MAG TPA: DNA polymerase [Terriglobales bacterium]|nr:DNA polymerase [Terriglobales bacterium]
MSAFLIDARFLLRNTTEAFWGAPLIVVDGKDNTFCFGFLRDLLRLRNSLHISVGAIVFGGDALSFATERDIRSVVDMCRGLGVSVIYEPKSLVLAVVATYRDRFSNIVTDDRRMLGFCTERRAVYLGKDPSSIERVTPDGVQQSLGVPARHVPTYLALTDGRKHGQASSNDSQPAVTTREARRLVELYGSLPGIYQHLSTMKSLSLRKKLADNQKIFDQRYRDNTACPSEAPAELQDSLEWKLEGKERESLLRERGFYSLIRMLPLTDPQVRPLWPANDRIRSSKSYQAVLNCREFNDMLECVALSKVCAIDTEADDKDPRTATLFGVSFALARGNAFFVPFCERDMGDLTLNVVQRGLKKLFKERIRFVGHNLMYDFMLLHRNAIEPPAVCFDTLLAAHDCYGDLDFFNLPFLAQKFLGHKIKAYKDIVPKGRTFLELPFEEMKEHACTDADVALQLHTFLERELKDRKIDQQFEERTMPLALALLKLEKDGIPVDGKRLEQLRCRLEDGMLELKRRVSDGVGSEIDLDSQEEISVLMREKLGLREVLGSKRLTQGLLEQLASRRPLLKLVVEYKRSGKKLRRVESIIKAIRRGRVYPLLSQVRDGDGRISSTDPDLFADDGLERLRDCVGGDSAVWFQDRRRSLDLAQQASGDLALKKDRTGPKNLNLFMKGQPSMSGVDHDDLLLRVLIGESSHRLSTRFLVDRLTLNNIVHALGTRYPKVFRYLADAKAQGLKRGYVEREGMRRYFDGFGSSSIEKRNAAQVLACRWLLQF